VRGDCSAERRSHYGWGGGGTSIKKADDKSEGDLKLRVALSPCRGFASKKGAGMIAAARAVSLGRRGGERCSRRSPEPPDPQPARAEIKVPSRKGSTEQGKGVGAGNPDAEKVPETGNDWGITLLFR